MKSFTVELKVSFFNLIFLIHLQKPSLIWLSYSVREHREDTLTRDLVAVVGLISLNCSAGRCSIVSPSPIPGLSVRQFLYTLRTTPEKIDASTLFENKRIPL